MELTTGGARHGLALLDRDVNLSEEMGTMVDPTRDAEGRVTPPAPWAAPSWDDVVRDHGTRVYRLAYRLTGNRYDAEDLTQEVFVRVFRSLSQYTPGTFEGWLHRITTNLFLDQVRRKARIRFEGLPDDAAALDALPPDFRVAVVLCDIEGLTYEEISELLGIKLGTVRSRIHRGRAQLRDSLAHRTPRTAQRLPTGGAP